MNPPEDWPAEDPNAPPNGLVPAAGPDENADPDAAKACFLSRNVQSDCTGGRDFLESVCCQAFMYSVKYKIPVLEIYDGPRKLSFHKRAVSQLP